MTLTRVRRWISFAICAEVPADYLATDWISFENDITSESEIALEGLIAVLRDKYRLLNVVAEEDN